MKVYKHYYLLILNTHLNMKMFTSYGTIIEEVKPNIYLIKLSNGVILTNSKYIYSVTKIDDHENPKFEPNDYVYITIDKENSNEVEYKGVKCCSNTLYEKLEC